jgi:hypothetical protein
MQRLFLVAAASLSILLSPAHASDSPLELQVFVEQQCPSMAPPNTRQALAVGALLVEGVLSALFNAGVDAAGTYLSAAASTKSVAFKGVAQEPAFYTLDGKGDLSVARSGGCVVLLVPGAGSIKPNSWFERAQSRSPNLQRYAKLPQLYFEASFQRPSDNAEHYQLRSRFLHVSSFQESSWASRDDRNYSFALTLRSTDDDRAFATATFSFDGIKPGTFADTQVVHINVDDSRVIDPSISANLNLVASARTISFVAAGAGLQTAVTAQKLVAAPYNKALALQVTKPTEPQPQEPEWTFGNSSVSPVSTLSSAYMSKMAALCALLEKKAGGGGDARCPIANLQAANELDAARTAFKAEMDRNWSTAFLAYHAAECKQTSGKWACAVPPPKTTSYTPYAWEATVVETRDPNAFAKALASAFAANKDKLKTELGNEILPSKREEAARNAQTAQRDAEIAYKVAMLKVEEAEAKLIEAASQPRSAQIKLQQDVLTAKVAANAAARTAGQPTPFAI